MKKSIVATNVKRLIKEQGLKQVYIAKQIGVKPKVPNVSIDSLFKTE